MIPDAIWLALLGFATGILGGYLGVGGGLLITVVLLEWFKAQGIPDELRFHLSFGTTLLAIIGTALSSSLAYQRMKRVFWPAVGLMATTAVLFALIGARLAALSSADILRAVFVVFCVVTAILLLRRGGSPHASTERIYRSRLALIGVFAGTLSAYLGVAGGAIMVPLLILWAHVPSEYAPGTSNTVGVLTSAVGAVGYMINGAGVENLPSGSWGFVVPSIAIPVLIGTLAGGPIGSHLNRRFGRQVFRYVFAAFLLLVAAKIYFRP